MERPLALLVGGGSEFHERLAISLAEEGVQALSAPTPADALETLRASPVRVLVLAAPGWSDEQDALVAAASRLNPTVVTLAVIERPSPSDEAGAARSGVFDVVPGATDPARFRLLVRRALAQHGLLEERKRLREQERGRTGRERIVGRSDAIVRLRREVEGLARDDGCVLFTGEPGTGKRLAALVLHALSLRGGGPFFEVGCAEVSEAILESEIFGTGGETGRAVARRASGLLESASGGTLLLFDVETLPLALQERLLAAIELRRSAAGPVPPDVRILAASRSDLRGAASEGRFRADLLAALSATTIALPALRERPEDIAPLAAHFVEEIRILNDLPPVALEAEALATLERHDWPGNVRELRNAIEQAVVLATGGAIRVRDLPEAVRRGAEAGAREGASGARFRDAKRRVVESFEKRYLEDLLARHRGNVTAAASDAGMLRSALQRLLRKYDLRSSDFRRGPGAPTHR